MRAGGPVTIWVDPRTGQPIMNGRPIPQSPGTNSNPWYDAVVKMSAGYDTPVPVVYGTARVGGKVVYLNAVGKIEQNISAVQGYDNGHWKQSDLIYTQVGVAICEGPIAGLTAASLGNPPPASTPPSVGWFSNIPHGSGTLDKLSPQFQLAVTVGGSTTQITIAQNGPAWLNGPPLVEVGDLIVSYGDWEYGDDAYPWGLVTNVSGTVITMSTSSLTNWSAGAAWVRKGGNTHKLYLGNRPGTAQTLPNALGSMYNGGTAWLWVDNMILPNGSPPTDIALEVQGFLSVGSGPNPYDANPSAVVVDLLTNGVYGAGLPSAQVDAINGPDNTAASGYDAYCKAMGFYVSGALTKQSPALDVLKSLLDATNSTAIWSQGKIKVIPWGDSSASSAQGTFTPATSAISIPRSDLLTSSPSEDPIKIERVSPASVMNVHPVEYPDRVSMYGTVSIESVDSGAATQAGMVRRAGKLSLPWVIPPAQAQQVSVTRAQRANWIRQTFRFRVGWRYCYLEPMDFVALNDTSLGFVNRIARIVSIEEGKDLTFEIVASDWPTGAGTPTLQNVQGTSGVSATASTERAAGLIGARVHATMMTATDNLVPNGNGELGVNALAAGGVAAQGLIYSPGSAYAGSWLRQFTATGVLQTIALSDPIPCLVGDAYKATALTKASVANAATYGYTVQFLDASQNVLSSTNVTSACNTSWGLIGYLGGAASSAYAPYTFTAPANAAYVQLLAYIPAAVPANTVLSYDQLYLRRVESFSGLIQLALEYYASAAQSLGNAVSTQVNFPTTRYDTSANVPTVSNPATAWRFTCPSGWDGYYQVYSVISCTGGGTAFDSFAYLMQYNSAGTMLRGPRGNRLTSSGLRYHTVSALMHLASGDYVQAGVYQASGVNQATEGNADSCYINVRRLPGLPANTS